MTQTAGWIVEEMARITYAERLAEAAQYRMAATASGTSTSPKLLLAQVLRSLATLLDGEPSPTIQPTRRSVGAF